MPDPPGYYGPNGTPYDPYGPTPFEDQGAGGPNRTNYSIQGGSPYGLYGGTEDNPQYYYNPFTNESGRIPGYSGFDTSPRYIDQPDPGYAESQPSLDIGGIDIPPADMRDPTQYDPFQGPFQSGIPDWLQAQLNSGSTGQDYTSPAYNGTLPEVANYGDLPAYSLSDRPGYVPGSPTDTLSRMAGGAIGTVAGNALFPGAGPSHRSGAQRSIKPFSSARILLGAKCVLVKPLELGLWTVLVDQSLEARVFAQRVPDGIELEHCDREAVWDVEQMIEQAKCFVEFPGRGINLGERSGALWPIKGVLGFRQQFDGALAFVDRFFFLTQGSKHKTQLSVSTGILRRFTHQFLCDSARMLECDSRVLFIALIQIKHPLKQSLRARCSRSGSQGLATKLLYHLKALWKLPLQRQNPNAYPSDEPRWVGFGRN